MKLLAIAALSAVGFAGVYSFDGEFRAHLDEHVRAVLSGDEDPPPVDCPFCGGDATAHFRQMRRLFILQQKAVMGAILVR
ncbi:MAG: hypothetical protein JNN27_20355 [Planctomycetes bacterium]|nr:hypothetical protein [Planctomycetota bacterium]